MTFFNFKRTVVLLPTNLRMSNHLRGRSSFAPALKQQLLFLFQRVCFWMHSDFTSASRRCRFDHRQPLRHSLSRPFIRSLLLLPPSLAFQSLLRLPVAVVGFLVVLLFCHWPLIRSLQLLVAIVGPPLVNFSFS